jgi:predicted nucleic acid-binding Zn ribbon protein
VSRRAPRPLGAALDALTGRLAPATLLGDVQRVWERAVGPAIAREAEPVSERAGVLTLRCSSAVWMAEIDLMGPQLLGQVNALLGSERVTGLRCVATTGWRGAPGGRG